jgi:signal transduction histidine kinase
VTGSWATVPAAEGYVLYRAAQEGLTNVRRHAPGCTATLHLERERSADAERVGFRLVNAVGPRVAGGHPGRGLVGMRERVEALGGTVDAAVRDGGFVLDVRLPLPPSAGVPTTTGDGA